METPVLPIGEFVLCPPSKNPPPSRSIETWLGIGDRLRSAAFAELQATEAFFWASRHYALEIPKDLQKNWEELAHQERKHMNWILERMRQLNVKISDRAVSDRLWQRLISCPNPKEFTWVMSEAERRGQKAGEFFARHLEKSDPPTALIFKKIAEEEQSHIDLAEKYYPRPTNAPYCRSHLLPA